jgi:adenylyl- and sulfurtransferase ThiI
MFDANCVIAVVSPEISLKSTKVRSTFIDLLRENISLSLKRNDVSYDKILFSKQRFFILSNETLKVFEVLKNCFGIHSLILAKREKIIDFNQVLFFNKNVFKDFIENSLDLSFAIRCKSFNKLFNSRDFEIKLGASIVQSFNLKVNLSFPGVRLNVLILEEYFYAYFLENDGARGMPVGCQGFVGVFSNDQKDAFYLVKNLLKCGCKVYLIQGPDSNTDLNNYSNINLNDELNSFNLYSDFQVISIEQAINKYNNSKIYAFFSNARSLDLEKEHLNLFKVKVFAPLILE